MTPITYRLDRTAINFADVRKNLLQEIADALEFGVIQITIEDSVKSKTRQQEKYAHKCIGIIADQTGTSLEQLKVSIKAALGLIETYWHDGKVITQTRSTADLKRDEYTKFIEAIKQTAQMLEIKLPEPDHYGY